MKESYDAIIIGAGVIGAAITLELARKVSNQFAWIKSAKPAMGLLPDPAP